MTQTIVNSSNCVSISQLQENFDKNIIVSGGVFTFKNPELSTSTGTQQNITERKKRRKKKYLITGYFLSQRKRRPISIKKRTTSNKHNPNQSKLLQHITPNEPVQQTQVQIDQLDSACFDEYFEDQFLFNNPPYQSQQKINFEYNPPLPQNFNHKQYIQKEKPQENDLIINQTTKYIKTKPISKIKFIKNHKPLQPILQTESIKKHPHREQTKNLIKNVLIGFKKTLNKQLRIKASTFTNVPSRIRNIVQSYFKLIHGSNFNDPKLLQQKIKHYLKSLERQIGRQPSRKHYMKIMYEPKQQECQSAQEINNINPQMNITYKTHYCRLTRCLFNQFTKRHWIPYFMGLQSPYSQLKQKTHLKYMLLWKTAVQDPSFQFDKVKIIEHCPSQVQYVPEIHYSMNQTAPSDKT